MVLASHLKDLNFTSAYIQHSSASIDITCNSLFPVPSRACMVLASHLKDLNFTSAYIQHSSASIDITCNSLSFLFLPGRVWY